MPNFFISNPPANIAPKMELTMSEKDILEQADAIRKRKQERDLDNNKRRAYDRRCAELTALAEIDVEAKVAEERQRLEAALEKTVANYRAALKKEVAKHKRMLRDIGEYTGQCLHDFKRVDEGGYDCAYHLVCRLCGHHGDHFTYEGKNLTNRG